MSKELKRELFNIYDVVVFEDENGITQDCVCAITKWEKEIDKIVGVIECNNHSISIYENGSYKVWKKDGKNLPYYNTGKKIIHLYTLKNDGRFYEVYPTSDYEDIDNANPSEALESLDKVTDYLNDVYDYKEIKEEIRKDIDTIKQALIKGQENEKALKIIFKKKVMIEAIITLNLQDYNDLVSTDEQLTQEESYIVKRWYAECLKN